MENIHSGTYFKLIEHGLKTSFNDDEAFEFANFIAILNQIMKMHGGSSIPFANYAQTIIDKDQLDIFEIRKVSKNNPIECIDMHNELVTRVVSLFDFQIGGDVLGRFELEEDEYGLVDGLYYANTDRFYSSIPCFNTIKSGIKQINNETHTYLEFQIKLSTRF